MDIEDIRREYGLGTLDAEQLLANPHEQFQLWLQQAIQAELSSDPTAMSIATVNANGQPSQRIVLLKGHDSRGLRFFTNKQSHKGQDLAANPHISCHFAWLALERQVHIQGQVSELPAEINDEYFHSRPKASQVGALLSQQSQPIESRAAMDERFHQLMEEYADARVPRPEHWGGYLIKPELFEFWQGGRNRLHDRFIYQRRRQDETQGVQWQITRLQP